MKHLLINILIAILFLFTSEISAQDLIYECNYAIAGIDENGQGVEAGARRYKEKGRKKRGQFEGRMGNNHFYSEEEAEVLLKGIKLDNPELFAIIKTVEKEHPRRYNKIIQRMLNLEKMKAKNPDRYKVLSKIEKEELIIETLSIRFKTMTDRDKKEKLKQKIKMKLENLFQKREKIKYEVIENLEKRLKQEKKRYEKRQKNRKKIIDSRLQKLLNEINDDDLRW